MGTFIKLAYRTTLAAGLLFSASASVSAEIGSQVFGQSQFSQASLGRVIFATEDEPPPRGGPADSGDGGSRCLPKVLT